MARGQLRGEYGPNDPHNLVTNRPGAEGYFGRVSNQVVVGSGVAVEWSNTGPTDYIAGGYWLYVDGNTNEAELGTFIDGPAFDDLKLILPVTGRATYNGRAGGVWWGVYEHRGN